MSSHHRILGVPPTATKIQIKRAYFKKAKVLHPDVNNAPNAEADFIRLNMAYEALTNPRYVHPPVFTSRKSGKSKEEIRREWLRKRNEELRKRATASARRKQKKAHEETQLFYNSFGFNFLNLLFSVFLLIPTSLGFFEVYLNPGEKPADFQALLIGIILLATGILLVFLFLHYLYKKIFK